MLTPPPENLADLPLIFDIARGSFSDGPGIRTTVFFKGCPLRCLWCHNPEAQNRQAEIFYTAADCIRCGNCRSGKRCFTGARREIGQYYPPAALLALLLSGRSFYAASGGGITLSGGEPLLFIDYLAELLPALKAAGIHILLQTSGYFDYPAFAEELLPYVDTIYYDLKLIDPALHLRYTGLSNELILQNLYRLVNTGVTILPRMPLIPHYTATEENLAALARLLAELKLPACEFLPYNPLWLDKASRLGKYIPPDLPLKSMETADITTWINYFKTVYQQYSGKTL